jgi:hypothetical protein
MVGTLKSRCARRTATLRRVKARGTRGSRCVAKNHPLCDIARTRFRPRTEVRHRDRTAIKRSSAHRGCRWPQEPRSARGSAEGAGPAHTTLTRMGSGSRKCGCRRIVKIAKPDPIHVTGLPTEVSRKISLSLFLSPYCFLGEW